MLVAAQMATSTTTSSSLLLRVVVVAKKGGAINNVSEAVSACYGDRTSGGLYDSDHFREA